MIDIEAIQTAVVARLKANATLTALLSNGATEIREAQWQGRDFTYPNVRVEIGPQTPIIGPAPCDWSQVVMNIHSFSEQDSSLECEQIASAVKDVMDRVHFNGVGFRFFYCHVTSMVGARRLIDNRIWRSIVVCQSDLHTI